MNIEEFTLKDIGAPLLLTIEVTNNCNLNCKYCYNRGSNNELNIIDFKKILCDAKEMHIFDISISGGEPFIHNDIIELIKLTKQMDFDISIVTNGTKISQMIAKELQNIDIIKDIQVSFDSHIANIHNKTRDSYYDALRGFINLCEQNMNIEMNPSVGIVINKLNFSTLHETISYFSKYTKRFHFMNVMKSKDLSLSNNDKDIFSKEIVPLLLTIKNEKGLQFSFELNKCSSKEIDIHINCLAGLTVLVISADLEIYPCDMARNKIDVWDGFGSLAKAFKKSKEKWINLDRPWCEKEELFNQ